MGDNISTVEDIQYSGGRSLISACLAINNDDIFCITIRNFHSEVSKVLADFMPFESWIGVLQPCFQIIDNFIFASVWAMHIIHFTAGAKKFQEVFTRGQVLNILKNFLFDKQLVLYNDPRNPL